MQSPFGFVPDRKLFSSTYSALRSLGTLGNPPQSPDISKPSTQCQSALNILAFLSYHNTTSWNEETYFRNVILKHWSSSIAAWYRCFLEQFVLAEEEPTTERGIVFREQILSLLPVLVTFGINPQEQSNRTSILLRSQGQFLVPLVAKTWLKLMKVSHPAAFRWANVIVCTRVSHDLSFIQELEQCLASSTSGDVAGVAIHEMLRFAHSCRHTIVEPDTLRWFEINLLIMNPCLYPSATAHLPFIARGGVTALVKVLLGLLSRPTLARYPHNSKGFTTGINTVKICLSLLKECLDYPDGATEALHAGLLKAFVKAAPYYDDGKWTSEAQRECNLADVVADVLERVSRLLVYPSVARQFTRSVKKYATTEWEELVEKDHETLSVVWESCLDNMDCVEEIRRVLKTSGSGLCDNIKLFSIDTPFDDCTSVQMKMKMSRIAFVHHAETLFTALMPVPSRTGRSTKLTAQGIPKISSRFVYVLIDVRLERELLPGPIEKGIFHEVIEDYVDFFKKEIVERLKGFSGSNEHYKDDVHPILVLDFAQLEPEARVGHQLMDTSCFNISSQADIFQDKRLLPGNHERIVEHVSSSSHGDPLELVVVAFFPGLRPLSAWPVVTVVGIPDGEKG
ncbi:hypothetical protein VNI00_005481 [Paramarasmius palmivorus]|uniref:Uncharacterized protein n=1 Tax=Paramarasmius palmivorus TaxID=297713 RepID=A0AAW0DDX6_9AGAR